VAGGLSAAAQAEVLNEAVAYLPTSIKRGKGPRPGRPRPTAHEIAEVWRTAASLERLEPAIKERLGDAVFAQAGGALPAAHGLWALARLGARVLLYGPSNATVARPAAERWIGRLLALPWSASPAGAGSSGGAAETVGFALAQLARRTEDRVRDIDDDLRARLVERFNREAAAGVDPQTRAATAARFAHFTKLITEAGESAEADRGELLGDELPPGLRLA
jgi:hypothetical protein